MPTAGAGTGTVTATAECSISGTDIRRRSQALREALDHLDVGNHHLVSGWRARLGAQLAASTEGALPYAIFTPSGSEAVDLAVRLARAHTRREKIVSTLGAYHGLAGFGWAASDPRWLEPFGYGPPGFVHVPFNDRGAVREVVDEGTAAVILEAIPATLGFPPPEPGYVEAVASATRERGALLIIDEVQTGLGRTGTPWYCQQEDVKPDILITGKGLGGGVYPVSAALLTAEVEAFFDDHPFAYVSTFGGAELGCAVASAVLDEVCRPAFLTRVRDWGSASRPGSTVFPSSCAARGLTMGLKFDQDEGGVTASKRLIDAGVFAVFAEHDHSVTQFKPPLILTDEEAGEVIGMVREALG